MEKKNILDEKEAQNLFIDSVMQPLGPDQKAQAEEKKNTFLNIHSENSYELEIARKRSIPWSTNNQDFE